MKDETDLTVVRTGGAVARPVEQVDIESLLRYAVDKGVTTEGMQGLMTIRRELNAEAAKRAFDAAMAAFQAECPPIAKTKSVNTDTGSHAYSYAPFEQILDAVRACLQKHGFSFSLDTDTESAAGWVIAKCIVTHSAGHSIERKAKFPMGNKTRVMSETQVFASALTFASRRVFCNAFGIVTGGEDRDGRGEPEKPKGPSSLAGDVGVKELTAELWNAMKAVRGPESNWQVANQFLWDERIIMDTEACPKLTADRFRQVISKVKARLSR